jgi:hypothetical protein
MTDPTTPVTRTYASPQVVSVDDDAHIRVSNYGDGADPVTIWIKDADRELVLTLNLSPIAVNGLRHLLNIGLEGAETLVWAEDVTPAWATRDLAHLSHLVVT